MITLEELDYLESMLHVLRNIEERIGAQAVHPPPSPPSVIVDPPNMSEVVAAIRALEAQFDPTVLAQLIRVPESDRSLDEGILEVLKALDFRMQGMGTQAYGGGSVNLQPGQTVGVTGGVQTREQQLVPLGFAQVTTGGAASSLSPPTGALYAMIQADNAIRYRDDGVDPSGGVGIQIPATGSLFYTGSLEAFRFVGVTAGAVVNIAYYGAA